MENLKFEFTKEEAQGILNALVKQPYIEVASIIDKLNKQAAEQLQEKPKMKVDKQFTFKTGRMKVEDIMQVTGHLTEKSFRRYIKTTKEDNARQMAGDNFFRK